MLYLLTISEYLLQCSTAGRLILAIDTNSSQESFFFNVQIIFSYFEEFDAFWGKISRVYNQDASSNIKIAKVQCKYNKKTCEEQGVKELLALKCFPMEGANFDCIPMMKFLNKTVQDSLTNYYDEETSIKAINSGNCFISFHVKYCGHCKKLSPIWAELEKSYENRNDVKLFNIDCKFQPKICDLYEISGYPSVIWIYKGEKVEKYSGHRNIKEFEDYIAKMLQRFNQISTVSSLIVENQTISEESAIVDVTADDFLQVIAKDFTFVYFCLKKCTYCQEVNNVWEELAQKFVSSSNVKIAQMDCNLYGTLCMKEGKGCPTLNLYKEGQLIFKDYHEDFSLEGLYQCVVNHVKGGIGKHVMTKF